MNLTTTSNLLKIVKDNLPASQSAYVVLRVGNKSIKDIEPNVVKRACVDILTKASFDMGTNMAEDPKVLQFQTEALYSEIKGKLADLTIPELKEAFYHGVRGAAGPFFGLCPRSYHQFLKWYHELPERQESWMQYLNLLNSDKDESGKDIPVNPEGQKKVLEALKSGLAPILEKENQKKVFKPKPIEKSPRDQYIQDCMREFDKLHNENPAMDEWEDKAGNKHVRPFPNAQIKCEGKIVDLTGFLQIKLTSYDKQKKYETHLHLP